MARGVSLEVDAEEYVKRLGSEVRRQFYVLACPRCGGRLRLLGTIEDPVAIRAILDSLAGSATLLERPPPAAMMEPALLATKV